MDTPWHEGEADLVIVGRTFAIRYSVEIADEKLNAGIEGNPDRIGFGLTGWEGTFALVNGDERGALDLAASALGIRGDESVVLRLPSGAEVAVDVSGHRLEGRGPWPE